MTSLSLSLFRSLPKTHLFLLSSFALALLLGLFVGKNFVSQKYSVVQDSASVANVGYFFLYIVFATALLLLALHYYKGKKLFFYAELLLEFSALQIFLSIFLNDLYSALLALFLVALRVWKKQLKQPLLFAACVVVGALLGSSFDLIPALVLGFLLAAYDYFAVFKSKHMVTLAKELQKREAAFAIQFTSGERRETAVKPRGRTSGLKAGGGGESVLLGTGDFVIPVMLSVSVLKTSVLSAVATALGAFVGLSILLFIMQKTRGYYPALPPIVMFSTLFFFASLLL